MPKYDKEPGRGFIDPGDVPPGRKGWIPPADNDHSLREMGLFDGPVNPDPINRPHYAQQGPGLGEGTRTVINEGVQIKGSPEREGPDYSKDDEDPVRDSLWFNLSYPSDLIPERTMWILQNPGMSALRAFIRHQLEYRDADEALGLQGQFAEIHHITAKLKRMIWKRRGPLDSAKVQNELENMIGHCLLALDLLEKGNNDGQR